MNASSSDPFFKDRILPIFGGSSGAHVKKHIRTETAAIDLRPNIAIGGFVTGRYLFIKPEISFYVEPRFSFELNDAKSRTPLTLTSLARSDKLLMEMGTGVKLFERIELQYVFTQRNALRRFSENYQLHTIAPSLKLDENGIFVLKGTYSDGTDPASLEPQRTYTIGLGAKF